MNGVNEEVKQKLFSVIKEKKGIVYKDIIKGNLLIIDSLTMEFKWGWLFFYNSKEYILDGDEDFNCVGNAPIFLDKISNEAVFIDTLFSKSINDAVELYASKKGYI